MRKRLPAPLVEESKKEDGEESLPNQELDKGKTIEGESLGFGFVSYTTIEAASRARAETKIKPFKG